MQKQLEKLNKLKKVQKYFEGFNTKINLIEVKQDDVVSNMVMIELPNKKLSVVEFNGKMVATYSTENFSESKTKPVRTQIEAIEMFEKCLKIKHVEKSMMQIDTSINIKPESTAMNVSRESESARMLLKLIKLENKAEPMVLDYGCGLGRNMLYMKKETAYNPNLVYIHGTDTDDQIKNIEKSSQYGQLNPEIGRLKIYNKEYLELNKPQYDYILNSHVLNVVMDDIKKIILDDMYKLLAVGGKAIIQVRTASDVESAKSKVSYGAGWLIKKGNDTTYQEGITKEKMEKLLTDAGFKIVHHRFTKSIHMVEVTK